MAQTIRIYNVSTDTSRNVVVDFAFDILADEDGVELNPEYYFKFTTSADDTAGNDLHPNGVLSLSDLALIEKQRRTNVATDYTSITDMIEDYIYEYVNGHTAGLYGSTRPAALAMDF